MVYESDFYTTRRPYSSRPTISSYSVTRSQEVDWSRYPTVPRPSQVPPVFTVFGRVPDPRSPVSGRLIPRTPLSTLYHPHTSIRKY